MRGLLKFTMDLFGDAPAVPLAPEIAAPDRALPKPKGEAPPAPMPIPVAVQPDVQFAHPRATREITLGGNRIGYEFTRGQRRTIGFVVGPNGLSVRAPRWVALRDVDAAVQDKADWILRKLAETKQRHATLEAARIEWCDGVRFPFLGEDVEVRLDGTQVDKGRSGGPGRTVFDAEARLLRIALAPDASPKQIRDAVQTWLMRQARAIFIARLDHFAPLLAVSWRQLSLSNAATRWGSASSTGAIRLHWRLVHFRMPVLDYVVAHELSHLRFMDHSPRFWATVESVVPDYGVLRRQLKEEAIPRW